MTKKHVPMPDSAWPKELMTPMTAEELNKRYDPKYALALSAEKWLRVCIAEIHGNHDYSYRENTCALCRLDIERENSYCVDPCDRCPLGEADKCCDKNGSLWCEFNNAYLIDDYDKLSELALAMYEKLIELLEKEEE